MQACGLRDGTKRERREHARLAIHSTDSALEDRHICMNGCWCCWARDGRGTFVSIAVSVDDGSFSWIAERAENGLKIQRFTRYRKFDVTNYQTSWYHHKLLSSPALNGNSFNYAEYRKFVRNFIMCFVNLLMYVPEYGSIKEEHFGQTVELVLRGDGCEAHHADH
ncbi:hypothetical protein WR25_13213 [Diploscapter pachys]|uniref:Uncharacterized protein n=1 Tax=Diploscapter pachys TaxID=2018661 RepID=A0A2A2L5B5_9BILA|nr:hypothetical protein WR25_13213 [Diploscapter pachys]